MQCMEEGGQVCRHSTQLMAHGLAWWRGPAEVEMTKIFPVRGRWRSYNNPSEESIVLFQYHILTSSSFPLCMDHVDPSALHENHCVDSRYCPSQNTSGKMREGKAGQPAPRAKVLLHLSYKGRVYLGVNEAGTTTGGCLQPGRCSKLSLQLLVWQLLDSLYFTNNHGWLPDFELWSGGVLHFSRSLAFSGVQLKHVMWSEMCFPLF